MFKLLISLTSLALLSYYLLGSHGNEDAKDTVKVEQEGEHVKMAEGGDKQAAGEEVPPKEVDFYTYTVKDMNGKDVSLESYRGSVTMVVNVASECTYTDSSYKDLVTLQTKFAPTGTFSVLAFPSNQFFDKEPGTNEDILKFAKEKYAVNFPIFGKTDVIGENATAAWRYLGDVTGHPPKGNFWKYIVDHNGQVLDVWATDTPVIELAGWVEDTISKIDSEGTHDGNEL